MKRLTRLNPFLSSDFLILLTLYQLDSNSESSKVYMICVPLDFILPLFILDALSGMFKEKNILTYFLEK